jgi:hypothetical protein
MRKKHIILVGCLTITALNSKANNQTPIPQTQNDNGRGSVTGIINRVPRTFDTQTLINSGPGLLEEGFFLLKRLGRKNPDKEKETTVAEPEAPKAPTTQEVVYKETPTVYNTSNQNTNNHSSSNTVFTTSSNQTYSVETIKSEIQEPVAPIPEPVQIIKCREPVPVPMVPAPRPGYIIRYNEQLKVYEEVREIKVQDIQPIQQ